MASLTETERRVGTDLTRLKSLWEWRDKRILAWYTLRRLVDRWKEPGKTSFVSNRPRAYFNVARHLLAGNPFRVRVLAGEESLERRHEDAVTERGVYSVFRAFDDAQWRQGRLPWRYELADQICMGWANVFYGVFHREGDETQPVFRGDIWDNLTVYPEWDDEGLSTVVHSYPVSEAAAQAKAHRQGKELPPRRTSNGRFSRNEATANRVVTEWFTRDSGAVWHATLIDGAEIVPLEEMEGVEEIPALVVPVNGESRRSSANIMDDPLKYSCSSVLELIERSMNDYNEWMTMIKQNTRDTAQPNYVDYTQDGQGFLDWEAIRRGGGVSHGEPSDRAEVLPPTPLPPATGEIMRILGAEIQLGSVPDSLFGATLSDASGYLYSQLQAAALTNIGPYRDAQDFVLRTLAQSYVEGFRDGEFGTIRIQARTRSEGSESGYFFEEWKPRDVADDVWVDVRTQLAIVRNRVQEIATMRQADPTSPALLDMTTNLDEIGGFDDPLLIQERIEEDMARRSPAAQQAYQVIHLKRLAKYYREQGDKEAADIFEAKAKQALEAAVAQPGAPAPTNPGAPPEAGGVQGRNGQSPDAMAALLQRFPPQAGRR